MNNNRKQMNNTRKQMTAVALAAVFGCAGMSRAAEYFWTGAGADTWWSTGGNWSSNVAPALDWNPGNSMTFDANTVKGVVDLNTWGCASRLKLASGLTNDILLFRWGFVMDLAQGSGVDIAADSRDLVMHKNIAAFMTSGLLPFTIGAGRTMTLGNTFNVSGGTDSAMGFEKKGAGTFVMASPNPAQPWLATISEGTLRTTHDLVLNTANATVSSGATLDLGATRQTVSRLSGGGTVAGARGDLIYTGYDGSQLISTNKNYVLALGFAKDALTVNGVPFASASTSGTGYSLAGSFLEYSGGAPSYATGSYATLLGSFYYNERFPVLTLSNLEVGKRYEAVIFCNQTWGDRPQDVTCVNGSSTNTLSVLESGLVGYFAYRFTAQTNSASIAMAAHYYYYNYNMYGAFSWFGATLEDMDGAAPGTRGGALVVDNSSDCNFEGTIMGEVALVKSGSGTLTLVGANTYIGATVISNGTLKCQPPILLVNAGFESPVTSSYVAMGSSDGLPGGWFSPTGDGLLLVRGAVAYICDAPAPEGMQELFMQAYEGAQSEISQVITVPVSGDYNLAFKAVGRAPGNYNYSAGAIAVKIDGVSQANWDASAFSQSAWGSYTANLTLSAGTHTLTIKNTSVIYGDKDMTTLIDDVSLTATFPTANLPSNTDLSLTGGVLDLGGTTQTVASVTSDAGVASNGTLAVTQTLVPGGLNAIGTLTVSSLTLAEGAAIYWDYAAGGCDTNLVQGTLSLPTHATVYVNRSEDMPLRATLFTSGAIVAPGGVDAWTVVGGKPATRVVLNGNKVQLVTPKGTLISIF